MLGWFTVHLRWRKLSGINIKGMDTCNVPDAAYRVGEPRDVSSHFHNQLNGSLLFTPAAFFLSCNISFSPATNSTCTWSKPVPQTPGGAQRHHDLPRMLVLGLPFALGGMSEARAGPPGFMLEAGQQKQASFVPPILVHSFLEGKLPFEPDMAVGSQLCPLAIIHGKPFCKITTGWK